MPGGDEERKKKDKTAKKEEKAKKKEKTKKEEKKKKVRRDHSSKKLQKIQKLFTVPQIEPDEIRLRGKLGAGCFGTVYVGECRSIEVAVKVPKKQDISTRTLRNFCKEVEIMSKIFHPNVCLFMGACTTPGNIQIVSEKLEGDLDSRIHGSAEIPLTQRMQWAKEAAQGMAWLHGNDPPIIHRDLKPANMLLDEHGKVKVCDFGLSHFMEDGLYDREPKGTPLYMAPEVMRNEEISEKVDIYSMGIIMWELLTQQDPFSNHSDYQVFVDAVCNKKERPPIPSWCPESLRSLITSCWNEDISVRPSMSTIVTLLDEVIADCAAIEYRQKIEKVIDDPVGRNFWVTNIKQKQTVPWEEFAALLYKALNLPLPKDPLTAVLPATASNAELQAAGMNQLRQYAKLGDAQAAKAAAEIKRRELGNFTAAYRTFGDTDADEMADDVRQMYCLKAILADNDEEIVTAEEFGRLLCWVGPLELPNIANGFLDRIVDLLSEPWFHGAIQTTHTENTLRLQAPGTFLVRFSNSQKGCYCISKVSKDKVIKHIVIPYQVGKGFQLEKTWYTNLADLLTSNKEKYFLQTPCPGSKYSWMFESDVAQLGGYLPTS